MPRKTICLNMIVKNESHIIRKTLENLTKYIAFDYYVISDTGSTDTTKEIIQEFFKGLGIPGELKDDEWKNFGHNRTLALAHAYKKTDYVFVWDADDEIAGDFKLPANLTCDEYKCKFGGGSITYNRVQLFNNQKRWRYVGVLHEYPSCLEPVLSSGEIQGDYYFISNRKGARSQDPLKYEKDAKVLEEGYEESLQLKDGLHMRYAFYCANSWKDANQPEKAIQWYKKVLTLENWSQEKYCSCMELYDLHERLGKPKDALHFLVEAFSYDNTRVECALRLIKYYAIQKQDNVAYAYYTLIQPYYENRFLTDTLSNRLFARVADYEFFLPYYMIIVSERVRKYETGRKMYEILATKKANQGQWWVQNLFYNLQFYGNFMKEYASKDTEATFFKSMLAYFETLREERIQFQGQHLVGLQKLLDAYRPHFAAPLPALPEFKVTNSTNRPRILLTVTTCKRLDLFTQTMNSILRTWKDINLIDSFFCVDDNSSEEDRKAMKEMYPFFDYYMKPPTEKGHRESMNIIWRKLSEEQPDYWIHLEDDWLFFKEDSYVTKSIQFLETYKDKDIHQILFNRNYAETMDGYDIHGGLVLEKGYLQHEKSDTISGRNCGYWPHYSFRPSMIRTKTILELGDYNSPHAFFERDYADRWFSKGYTSAFFDTVCSLHIGKLTSDKKGTNAYTLNGENQGLGDQPGSQEPKTLVLNLARRPDRKKEMETRLQAHGVSATFYKAVDGKELVVTEEIVRLFKGNDFGSRRGFIGCALSHYEIWKEFLESEAPFLTVLEDDIEVVSDFKQRLEASKTYVSTKLETLDLLFLGYTVRDSSEKTRVYETPYIPLDKNKYVGGTFGYILTRRGAKKMLDFIHTNGIKHGIDYLFKLVPDFSCETCQPHCVLSEWVVSQSGGDSDIQKSWDCLNLEEPPLDSLKKHWVFFRELDSVGGDIGFVGRTSVGDLVAAAGREGAKAFNTLGFLKKTVHFPLTPSPYVKGDDGLWVKKVRVKFLCNWKSSKDVCEEWNRMSKGNYSWNAIEAVWDDRDIDYYCILNKPRPGDFYVPERTIIFHLEPWCEDPSQKWGVKTWGEFARPDLTKFFQVRSHNYALNAAFWQTSWSYTDYKTRKIEKDKGNAIGCICSSKYFDPGHKKRIDFLKFVEEKNDPDVQIHLYNEDNNHGFKNYKGKARPFVDKEKGILPYKYYFMVENNVERNFITEKLWEPIVCETLCFYSGCPNVSEHVDTRAFVELDMDDFESSFQRMKKAICESAWEKRLPVLRSEKERVLEELGVFPALERAIFHGERLPVGNVCFLHCCNNPNGQGLEKLDLLLKTPGLFKLVDKVIVNVTGPMVDTSLYKDFPTLEFRHEGLDIGTWELPTLRLISEYAKKNPGQRILYLHTKGISYSKEDPRYSNGLDWIQYMLYFLVEKSAKALELLETCDTVGCNYQEAPFKHYSGNFWWATTDYLATLEVDWLKERMDAEKWICSGEGKHISLYNTGKDHYWMPCKREEYCPDEEFVFFQELDSGGNDLFRKEGSSVDILQQIAKELPSCVAFNTLGYMKHSVSFPLTKSQWFGEKDGLYVKKSHVPT